MISLNKYEIQYLTLNEFLKIEMTWQNIVLVPRTYYLIELIEIISFSD